MRCKLCPYRAFGTKRQLIEHMKYHSPPFSVAPASAETTFQHRVGQALHRQRAAASVIGQAAPASDLLEASAERIRERNRSASEEEAQALQRSSQVRVVLMWTTAGPEYLLRSLAGKANRLSEKLYFTGEFEDLVVSLALRSRGQEGPIIDDLCARWASDPRGLPFVFCQSQTPIRECMRHLFTRDGGIVQNALRDLKRRATARGEWVAIGHDATHKCCLSVIGPEKTGRRRLAQGAMEQAQQARTAHTFMGVAGACPGFSVQRGEGPECFASALREVLCA
ncbi:unnamed protein product [Prorocentrum cordatum]|uniref:C2H2-type domain-containing protein n=1 Tax=Prorocentrum cordatum TaxID=2364126 RepID=A0ABN9TVF8_9DINO|nr:unnamed protein product [Polarella glacialis]